MALPTTDSSTSTWRRINRSDIEWEDTYPPGHSEVVPVRWLSKQDPHIAEAKLSPGFVSLAHWHPSDVIYLFTEGSLRMPAEPGVASLAPVSEADDAVVADGVLYEAGDIRWVRGGTPYGPELVGPDGARFYVFSFGGEPEVGVLPTDPAPVSIDFNSESSWRARWADGIWESARLDGHDLEISFRVLGDVGVHAILIRLEAGTEIPAHWCDTKTLMVPVSGAFSIEGEGTYQEGNIRVCERRSTSGPLHVGKNGAEFVHISSGGPLFMTLGVPGLTSAHS